MNLKDCHNFSDFRKLAKKKLPSPIFHYIDGAADDEVAVVAIGGVVASIAGVVGVALVAVVVAVVEVVVVVG